MYDSKRNSMPFHQIPAVLGKSSVLQVQYLKKYSKLQESRDFR